MAISRRNALKIIGATPVAAGLGIRDAAAQGGPHAGHQPPAVAPAPPAAYRPKFFTAHEWATVAVLVNIVIPGDDRSGSATDAGVPEFMDFMMTDRPYMQVPMRGGLRWLDAECSRRFGKTFVTCTDAERTLVLDDIAYPLKAKPEFSHGTAFFTAFRDLTATGFWTSRMGIEDLKFMGNLPTVWDGCPQACLDQLGVKA